MIDDIPDIREFHELVLVRNGFRVLTAHDGPAGLALAREVHPDIILLDMGLPVMDGWEVARQLRADPATRDVRIVAVTAYATEVARQEALAAGADAYLAKPCHPDELLSVVERLRPNA